ncbi:MAG: ComEC/Rec2 family competence protein [Planctomycetes bacterium]|nr:ComEC/Rec2 family competence protein [Planctomycetota bacterium]
MEQLIEESRTATEKLLRAVLRIVWVAFAISSILGIANAPLILAWQNLVSPVGILLGPPLVLLTSVALVAGFILLLVSPLGVWIVWPFAKLVEWSLAGCELLVHAVEQIPGAWIYAPAPSAWWLIAFYLGVAGAVLLPAPWSRRCLLSLVALVFAGLAISGQPRTSDECRFTFLSIGHGCCVLIETPDGRVLLYDAGTTTGPDAVRRVIAPYLWSRGITRIDEVFISHADLDHFNGAPELLKRFPVGRVTLTPTFTDKSSPGVEAALAAFERHKVATRIAVAGDRFEAGRVTLDVLHPPAERLAGNENTRSMVLLVRSGSHTVLLTGDLEGLGQTKVQERPVSPVDVMLAPHHGAKSAHVPLPSLVATWAKPKFVISSQRPGPTEHLAKAYPGASIWDTPTAGAVTVRCHSTGVVAEAFRSSEVLVVKRGQ